MNTRTVTVVVDRPMGSAHPRYPELIYPINYGYIPNTLAADGEPEDAYILGMDHPVASFTGQIIAKILREDDAEFKWVVAPAEERFTQEQIYHAVYFQEQYFRFTIQLL